MDSPPPPPHHPPPSTSNAAATAPNSSAAAMQNQSFPLNSGGGGVSSGAEPAKKKRGRPRKYFTPNGHIGSIPGPSSGTGPIVPFSAPEGDSGDGGSALAPAKRKRKRRPSGSGKKQLDAFWGGIGLTTFVIPIAVGEDICTRIMTFSQLGPHSICVLSATGAVSSACLFISISGGTMTYEGHFEILSLSGSFIPFGSNGNLSRKGGLSVTLAGADGRVLGGAASGMLIAASPVQLVVGSFIEDETKQKHVPPLSPEPDMENFALPLPAASPSPQGPSAELSDENGGAPYDGGYEPDTNANQQPLENMYSME